MKKSRGSECNDSEITSSQRDASAAGTRNWRAGATEPAAAIALLMNYLGLLKQAHLKEFYYSHL